MDLAAGRIRYGGFLAARSRVASRHLVAVPSAAGAARSRHAVLPPLPAQPQPPGALSPPQLFGDARWRAATAGDRRTVLRGAVHAGPGTHAQGPDEAAQRRTEPADPARRWACQPQSRCAGRVAARSFAAAASIRRA